jgi:hypothetical protein
MAGNGMPRKKGLSLKEKAFAEAYGDPSKPSFGVGVQAAMQAGYGELTKDWESKAYQTANRAAVSLLRKTPVQSEIQRIFSRSKLTLSDRSDTIASILHQPTKETIHETFNSDNELVSRQVIISSNASERLKAVDIASRMDGTYSRAANESQLHTKVLGTMLEEYSRKMRRVLQAESIPIVVDSVDTESEQSEVQADSDDAVVGQEQGIGYSLEGTPEGTESSLEGRG